MASPQGERQPLLESGDGADTTVERGDIATNGERPGIKLILVAIWTAVFLGALDTTIVATLLSAIGSDFEKAHRASFIGTAYLLSVCCFTSLYGRLSDILGRKDAMLLAQMLFLLGTLLCGLARSMTSLIVARAIAGMGGGGVMTVASITMTDLIPLNRRGLYQGWTNIIYGLGAGLGGPMGGFLNDHFHWRWAFHLQVPVLVLSIFITVIFLKVGPPEEHSLREKLARIDWLGSFTLLPAVGGFVLAATLQAAEEMPLRNPIIWGLYLCSGVCTIGFILLEALIAKEPIMPIRLLGQRTPAAVSLNNLLISMNAFSMIYNYPLFFTAVRLTSSQEAGFHMFPNAVAVGLGSVVAGLYIRMTGRFYYFNLGCLSLCVFSSLSMATWSRDTSPIRLWVEIVPSGFGWTGSIVTTLIALIASVERADIAVATGISYLFRTTGQVVGVAASSAILQTILVQQLRSKITGADSTEIIARIRHSTTIIPSLDPHVRTAAVASYAAGLRAVFIFQAALSFLALLASIPIEENLLPGSAEEQAEWDIKRSHDREPQETAA